MKNLNLTFYAFAGISSMPVTLLAGQFQPEKKSIDKQHSNIVLIVADDLGYGDLSCYGLMQYKLPVWTVLLMRVFVLLKDFVRRLLLPPAGIPCLPDYILGQIGKPKYFPAMRL